MSLFKKNEVAVVQPKEVEVVTPKVPPVNDETITKYMKAFGLAGTLTPTEVEAYKEMAIMYNLNPFKREIHCSAYGQGQYRTLSIVVGYETYIRKAEESGLLEYWDVVEAGPEVPIEKYYATLVVKRKDRKTEQKWTAYYTECFQTKKDGGPNQFWRKQPRTMTRKVAMSQGFRLFFEDVMHGIPYTMEEMPDQEEKNVTPSDPQPVKRVDFQPVKNIESKPSPEAYIEPTVEDDETVQETEEVAPVAQETSNINYFGEIMALVSKSSLLGKRKMEIVGNANSVKNDDSLLADLYNDVKREIENV